LEYLECRKKRNAALFKTLAVLGFDGCLERIYQAEVKLGLSI
jgi:hypothetical protein